jgi:GxxExxY protein
MMEYIQELTGAVTASAIEVHRETWTGAVRIRGRRMLSVRNSHCEAFPSDANDPPVIHKGLKLDRAYRLDVIIAEKLIVEVKTLECILPVHKAQLLTYLQITGTPVGPLINFNSPVLKDGIVRRVL